MYIHMCTSVCSHIWYTQVFMYTCICVYTCVYTWHPHSGGTQMLVITTYSWAGFEDLLRKCMCYILYRLHTIVFWDYPGPQSLTLLLFLRIVTRVHMRHRIKGRKECPELFFTAGLRDPSRKSWLAQPCHSERFLVVGGSHSKQWFYLHAHCVAAATTLLVTKASPVLKPRQCK